MNPLRTGTQSFLQNVSDSLGTDYDPKRDPKFHPELGADADPTEAVSYEITISPTDGGRGNSIMRLSGADLAPVFEALSEFDPTEDLSGLSPEEVVRRTIGKEEDTITFKTSLAKNQRTHKIPVSEWGGFLELFESLGGTIETALEHWRNVTTRANEAAAKAAAQPPRVEGAPNPDGTPVTKRGPGRPRKVQPAAPEAAAPSASTSAGTSTES